MSLIPKIPFHTLHKGDQNEFVTDVKKQLIQIGLLDSSELTDSRYEPSEYDQNTFNAVLNFQRESGLSVDGVVGTQTWFRLMVPRKTSMVMFFNKSIFFNHNYKGTNIFNNQPTLLFMNRLNLLPFLEIFSDVKRLTGKEQISLNEFVAHFSIMYNETGGLNAFAEIGKAPYMFGTNGGRKFSYNNPKMSGAYSNMGNIPAGDQLKVRGVISSDADVQKWNGIVYPTDAPSEVKKAAEECDFYKFRGRGLHQLTFRENYETYANPILKSLLNKGVDELSNAELDDIFKNQPEIYTQVFRNFITKQAGSNAIIENIKNQANFEVYGEMVAGATRLGKKYAQLLFSPRCQTLKDAILHNLKPKDVNNFSLEG